MPTNMAISIRWARIVVLNVHVAIESGSPISIYIYIYFNQVKNTKFLSYKFKTLFYILKLYNLIQI